MNKSDNSNHSGYENCQPMFANHRRKNVRAASKQEAAITLHPGVEGGGAMYSKKVYTGRLRPKVQPLPLCKYF